MTRLRITPTTSSIQRALGATVATLAALTLAAAPALAGGGRNYDTNRDGKPDVAVVGLDTNRDGKEDTVLIDTNRNGVPDPGEIQCQCPDGRIPVVKATPANNGLRVEFYCGKGKNKQLIKAVVVMDQNGDGDTADQGEVRPG